MGSPTDGRHQPSGASTVLSLTLVVATAFLVYAVGVNARQRTNIAPSLDDILKSDPPVGTRIRLPEKDVVGRPIPRSGPILVVAAGSCNSCSSSSLDPESVSLGEYSGVVWILRGGPEEAAKEFENLPQNHFVLADARSELHIQLNAGWTPRYFVLGKNFDLIKIQKQPRSVDDFVSTVSSR
jgi:hypothetical protein